MNSTSRLLGLAAAIDERVEMAEKPQPKRSRSFDTALGRFAEKIALDDNGCWIWLGGTIRGGYGHFYLAGKWVKTHRWSYEHFVGPIADGLVIDHLCRVRACCNPEHLEPVTPRENFRRGEPANRTHCPRNHPYDEENTRWGTFRSGRNAGYHFRMCRTCEREKAIRRREAAAEARRVEALHCLHWSGSPAHSHADCCLEEWTHPCELVSGQQERDHDEWWALLWQEAPSV